MGRPSPRNGDYAEDLELQVRCERMGAFLSGLNGSPTQARRKNPRSRRGSRSKVRADSRDREAQDYNGSHGRGRSSRWHRDDRHYDHANWNQRDSRSRNARDNAWRSNWKEDVREWGEADSRSRRSRERQRERNSSRPRSAGRNGWDGSWRRGDAAQEHHSWRPERSRSRSFQEGYGYGYGQSRKGPDTGSREAQVDLPKEKKKPGAKRLAGRKRSLRQESRAEDGDLQKTAYDPYQLIDPSEQVKPKVLVPDPESEQNELGTSQVHRPLHNSSRGYRARSRSGSRSSFYSYSSYGSYYSSWSTGSSPRRANSRSPSPGRPSRPLRPTEAPPGPPPGSWSQPQEAAVPSSVPAMSTGSASPPQYSIQPGPSAASTPAWDYRGHPPGHYPHPHAPPGHVQPAPHFYRPSPYAHYPAPGFPAPPPGYALHPFAPALGYGKLQARAHHHNGHRRGPIEDRGCSTSPPRRNKKKRRKNRRPKSPGEPPPKWGETWEEPRASNGLKLIHELAPKGLKWKLVLCDDSRRSYAAFMPSPVQQDRLATFFKTILENTEWQQPEGPHGLMPRKTAWVVKPGCRCSYRYGGVVIPPQEFPPWMTDLLRTYMPYCGKKNEDEWPDSCNVNLYEDGSHAVGWHTDDEALFQSLHEDVAIVSLSLGQARKFDLKKNWPEEGEKVQERLHLGNGALATMEGMLQKHYMHRVAREDESLGPRINLTWRWIKKHSKACPKARG
ncbi:unnamed protein product [Durusdinium trenchii]|uniref:Fe2OG dioxygenase domain-containing protein n=1 Tax=Durusdinium trenchii TaxID=1381693 RepID=A0ABP0MVU2_9DINO